MLNRRKPHVLRPARNSPAVTDQASQHPTSTFGARDGDLTEEGEEPPMDPRARMAEEAAELGATDFTRHVAAKAAQHKRKKPA